MEKGIVNIGSSMKFLQEKVNVLSNNISNSDTLGYKRDTVIAKGFSTILESKAQHPVSTFGSFNIYKSNYLEEAYPGVYVDRIFTSFIKGDLISTGNFNDLAISGEGFMVVGTERGDVYLSSASTHVDSEGFLTIPAKGRVKGMMGDVRVGFDDYNIEKNGLVMVNGRIVDKIKVVNIVNKDALIKVGDGAFTTEPENVVIKDDAIILKGHLEASNVDITKEMTELIETSRKYETNQRTVQMLDEIYGIAVNKLGRV